MVNGYKSLKDAIVSILNGVTSLKVVYAKEEKKLADFPAACVSAKEHTSDFDSIGSSGTNERVYQHYIRIYFRTDETNDPDYEDVLESVADDVVFALEQNVTLSGACEYAIPSSGVWKNGEKETPVRVFELVMKSTVHLRRDNGILV